MRIERVDPADGDLVRACHAVHVAASSADDQRGEPPLSLGLFTAWLERGWACDPAEAWYVAAGSPGQAGPGGPVAGWCRIQRPDLENHGRAFVTPVVHPALRRRGLGRELLRHAARQAADDGRTVLDGVTVQGSAGEAFARRLGAEPGPGRHAAPPGPAHGAGRAVRAAAGRGCRARAGTACCGGPG